MCFSCVFFCFARDGLALVPLPHGVRDLLRLVIAALTGLSFEPADMSA